MLDFLANLNIGLSQELPETTETVSGMRVVSRSTRLSSPNAFWYDGATYIGGTRIDADNNTALPLKWKDGVLSYKNNIPIESSFDPAHHDSTTVWVVNGYAYYIKVNGHGGAILIYRFDVTQDISTASLYHTIGGSYSYVNLCYFEAEQRMVIMSRTYTDHSQFILVSGVNDFTTWTIRNTTITNGTHFRHYPGSSQHYGTNSYQYFPITARHHSPTEVYYAHILAKSNDFGKTLISPKFGDSFSKDIDVEGKLTVQEIEDHFTLVGSVNNQRDFVGGFETLIISDTVYSSYFNPSNAKWYFRKMLPDGTIIDKLCLIPNLNTTPNVLSRDHIELSYNGNNLIIRTSNGLTDVPQIYSCDLNFGNLTFQMDLVTDQGTELEHAPFPSNFPNITGSYIFAQSTAADGETLYHTITGKKFTLNLEGISRANVVYPLQSESLYVNQPLDIVADISGDNITKVEYFENGVLLGERTSEPFDQFTYTPLTDGVKAISVKTYEDGVLAVTSEDYDIEILATEANTVIGNAASFITTKAALATKLGISELDISYFNINGNDVEAIVEVSYSLPGSAFRNTGITFYKDFGKKLTGCPVGSEFRDNANFVLAYLPVCVFYSAPNIYGSVFAACSPNLIVYTDPFNATSNSGGENLDLVGLDVRYIDNFTTPSTITDLAVGEAFATAIELNITEPTTPNEIDYYEVYVDGVLETTIKGENGILYFIELTPSNNYDISLIAVDEFYNKSARSNIINATTIAMSYADVDADAYITAANLTPLSQRESVYLLFDYLKANSLYNKTQAIYLFKGTTAAQHKWNAKNPLDTNAAFRLAFTGTAAFSNLGYQLNGGSHANTFFIPSANQSLNSNGMTLVVGTNNSAFNTDTVEMGAFNSGTQKSYVIAKGNNTTFQRVAGFNANNATQTGVNDSRGIFTGTKKSATVTDLFVNGVKTATANGAGSLPTVSCFIGGMNLSGSVYGRTSQRIQMAIIHEGFSDAEVTVLHSIINLSESIAGRKTW